MAGKGVDIKTQWAEPIMLAHLDNFATGLSVGSAVTEGDVAGESGTTHEIRPPYETQATIQKTHSAVIFINFDPETYRVAGISLVVDETIPSETVIAELAEYSYRRERRHVENDDLNFWVTDEIDPQGEATVLIFADLDLEVTYLDFVTSTSFDFGRGSAPLPPSSRR